MKRVVRSGTPSPPESVTDVRIFGTTKVTINYFDYSPRPLRNSETASVQLQPDQVIADQGKERYHRCPTIDQCIILAAGNGSRLVQRSGGKPKPLVELQGGPLLGHVILRAQQAGVINFTIVVGYRGDAIRAVGRGTELRRNHCHSSRTWIS